MTSTYFLSIGTNLSSISNIFWTPIYNIDLEVDEARIFVLMKGFTELDLEAEGANAVLFSFKKTKRKRLVTYTVLPPWCNGGRGDHRVEPPLL